MSPVCFLNKRKNCAVGSDHRKSLSDVDTDTRGTVSKHHGPFDASRKPRGQIQFNNNYPRKTGECTPDQRQEYELGLGPPETYRLGDFQKTACDLLSVQSCWRGTF